MHHADPHPLPFPSFQGDDGFFDSDTEESSGDESEEDALHVIRRPNPLRGHTDVVTCVRIVSEANQAASGDATGCVIIWDLLSSTALRRCEGMHIHAVTCIAISASIVVSGGRDGTLCVIDATTGRKTQSLLGHEFPIADLQFDTSMIISVDAGGIQVRANLAYVMNATLCLHNLYLE